MCYVIAARRDCYENSCHRLAELTGETFHFIQDTNGLSAEMLNKLQPKKIFFPHWSDKIPPQVYENFVCIGFHMTDLPYGRGGSPLQNLIAQGMAETKLTALRIVEELDAGPVYLKYPLSLCGTAEEIYLRAQRQIEEMIIQIIEKDPEPLPQSGDIVRFSRRKPEDGDLSKLDDLQTLFDYIRMLDAEDYPKAFIELDRIKVEFSRAALKEDSIVCDARIRIKR